METSGSNAEICYMCNLLQEHKNPTIHFEAHKMADYSAPQITPKAQFFTFRVTARK